MVAASMLSPAPRRSHSRLLLPLAAAGLLAVALQGLSFVAPSKGLPTVSRRQALRAGRVAVAARGGADDEDEDYEFDDYAVLDVANLKPGQEIEGVVTKLVRFGAFVDMGTDKEGLVPLGKMADTRVEKAEDVVSVGDSVKCWVVEVKDEKVTLTMSKNKIGPAPERKPRAPRREKKPQADVSLFTPLVGGDFMEGTVVTVANFGAFVEVPPPNGETGVAQGLVHITQIKDGFVEKVEDEVSVGDTVKVRVLSADTETGKIALSMKEEGSSEPAPRAPRAPKQVKDVKAFDTMSDEEWLTGTVKSLVNFGAFVEVSPASGGPSAEGLVHISQIQDDFLEDPAEVLEVGMDVKVRVIEVDTDKGKVGLSMKNKAAEAAEA